MSWIRQHAGTARRRIPARPLTGTAARRGEVELAVELADPVGDLLTQCGIEVFGCGVLPGRGIQGVGQVVAREYEVAQVGVELRRSTGHRAPPVGGVRQQVAVVEATRRYLHAGELLRFAAD